MPEAIVANDDLSSFEKSPSRCLPMSGAGTFGSSGPDVWCPQLEEDRKGSAVRRTDAIDPQRRTYN